MRNFFRTPTAFALDLCWTIYWYRRITILTYKIYQTYSTHSVPLRKIKLILRCKTIFIECTKWNDEYVVRKLSIIARREKTFVLNWQFNLWYLQLGTGIVRVASRFIAYLYGQSAPRKKEIQLYTWRHVIWLPISPAVSRPTLRRAKLRLQLFLHAASVPESL